MGGLLAAGDLSGDPVFALRAEAVPVKAGRTLGEVREVTPLKAGALASGDKVVVQAEGVLKAGVAVRPAEQ